jgi:hypothetical protein
MSRSSTGFQPVHRFRKNARVENPCYDEEQVTDESDPNWFRQPTPREHRIASMLFGGFGLFFIAFSFVLTGSWFQWLFLILGAFSVVRAGWHFIRSRRA